LLLGHSLFLVPKPFLDLKACQASKLGEFYNLLVRPANLILLEELVKCNLLRLCF